MLKDPLPDERPEDYQFQQTSLVSLGTGVKYEDPKFHLNLVQKKELPSERPIIDSTKWQRLSFYRAFTAAPSKNGIIASSNINLTSFLWFYTFNVFFKSLPHGFVHFFEAAYAREEHMFVAKMVPFGLGIKFLFIVASFLEIMFSTDTLIMLFYYAYRGVIAKNPWNRCPHRTYFDLDLNVTITCYEIEEFAELFANQSYEFWEFTYLFDYDHHFQVAQVEYYRHLRTTISKSGYVMDIIVFLLVWGAIQLLHFVGPKRSFWKVLNYSHWGAIFVDIASFLYLIVSFSEVSAGIDVKQPKRLLKRQEGGDDATWHNDNQMISESITAPQVVHVLTSRSTQEIDPSTDSSQMIVSNALLHIFRGLHSHILKRYCESMVHTEIPIAVFNQLPGFFLWPMFWHTFWLGDIFSVLYIAFTFVSEMLILSVAYLCLMEMVIYEWTKVKRWMAMLAFSITGILLYLFTSSDSRAVLFIYSKGIATLMETVFIYLLYPIGRLVDDFTFHYGIAPTQLRILSIRLVPVYYMFKIYFMFRSVWQALEMHPLQVVVVEHYMWSWVLMLLPILGGMLFTIYKYLVIHRATWTYILRPIPKWGPRDFSVRQLRKQFDSRFYISSEVPRLLSRYVLSKRQYKIYKVDVRYDVQRRSTVSKAVGFGEYKKKVKSM